MPRGDLPDDLQRPLDESVPAPPTAPTDPPASPATKPATPATPAPEPPAPELRQAAPATAAAEPEPAPELTAAAAKPEPAPELTPAVAPEPVRHAAPARLTLRVIRAPGRALGRGARAAWGWTRRPVGRFVIPSMLALALVGAAGAAGGAVLPGLYQRPEPDDAASPGAAVPTGANESVDIPTSAPLDPIEGPEPGPVPGPGEVTRVLHTWAVEMADRTGIPVVAVQAYGYAELVLAQTAPGCQLRWTTLAAIGRVESNHGGSGGSKLLRTGQALPPIYGDPLDGTGNRLLITDTDQGELDDDTRYDRAVGPMQFIPATWRLEAVDGSGDGLADVHNIYDAALAAGNYLCRDGRDLSNIDDWWQAILSYNNLVAYANAVYAAANEYGELSH